MDGASAKIAEDEDTRLIAGGTALVIMMKEGILTPKRLVDISQVESMRKIAYDPNTGLTIGAMVTHREIENSEIVAKNYPTLREAFRTIGNVRIRSIGTIGGNLAYAEPQCNPPAILSALDATIHVKGPNGERGISADEFILGIFESALQPGEIITRVTIPPLDRKAACAFSKFTTKSTTDKPTSTVAAYVNPDSSFRKIQDCRIVVGAVGPKTYRCRQAEEIVKNSDIASVDFQKVAKKASTEFEVMDDLYGPGWYKRHVTQILLQDTLKSAFDLMKGQAIAET